MLNNISEEPVTSIFYPEHGGFRSLLNVGNHPLYYTESYPRMQQNKFIPDARNHVIKACRGRGGKAAYCPHSGNG
jgi:hypothetical protein